MTELFRMWRDVRMITLVPVVAAIYAVAEIVLAPVSVVLIPGVVQFKVSNVLTMALGVLFGPAGAWGVGIGNLISDAFTGSFALGSGFGFLSSVAVGYIGYRFWRKLGPTDDQDIRPRDVATYLGIGVVGAMVSAITLAWGLELLGIAPFRLISNILVANFIVGSWAGAVIYFPLRRRLGKLRLTWASYADGSLSVQPVRFGVGAAVIAIVAPLCWILGAYVLPQGLIVPVAGVLLLVVLAAWALV